MSKDHLSYDELMQIAEFVESSTHFTEFHLKVGDIEIDLRKKSVDGCWRARCREVAAWRRHNGHPGD